MSSGAGASCSHDNARSADLALVDLVAGIVPLDRFEGLGPVHRQCRVRPFHRERRLDLLGTVDRLRFLGLLGPFVKVTLVAHVVPGAQSRDVSGVSDILGGSGGPIVLAHRGDWLEGRSPAPQNSITAVLDALAAGADGAEVDARLTADGAVVLHHDAHIGPADIAAGCPSPIGAPVCSLGRRELAHISTLADLLDAMQAWVAQAPRDALAPGPAPVGSPAQPQRSRPAVLNIELKDLPGEPGWDGDQLLASRVAAMLLARPLEYWPPQPASATPRRPGLASGTCPARLHVVVSSFDAASLARFHNDAPGAAVALLLDTAADWRRALAGAEGLRAVHPAEADAQPELFAAAAACHMAVVPWTVDDACRAVELAALGAAGLITNKPRALLRAFRTPWEL